MRLLFLALFTISSALVYGQKIIVDNLMIRSVLETEHNSRISEVAISEHLATPTVCCRGGDILNSDSTCFVINYIVEKDSSGSKFGRILYIPVYLSEKEVYSQDDYCFYEDHCLSGPHFDKQGGRYLADENTKKILSYIK